MRLGLGQGKGWNRELDKDYDIKYFWCVASLDIVYHTTWWVGSCIVYGISLEDYLHRI